MSPKLKNLGEVFEAYLAAKSKELKQSSLKGLRRSRNHVAAFPTQSLSPEAGKQIRAHLLKALSQDSAFRTWRDVCAALKWAEARGEIDENPFGKIEPIKRPRKKKPIHPFTQEEKDRIIAEFYQDPIRRPYALFIEFLFLTGCRPSEAVGLCWRHIDSQITTVTFAEPVVEGNREATTKTGEVRRFPVNDQLRALLRDRRPENPGPDSPVFVTPNGELISINNLLRRHWKPILGRLGVSYRPLYDTRHTFITLCLESGIKPPQIAKWVGNSPEIIFKNYAGFIPQEVPEL